MDQEDIEILRQSLGSTLRLVCTDGEQATCKVLFISDSEQDVICEVISSTRKGFYETLPNDATISFPFDDIVRVEPL